MQMPTLEPFSPKSWLSAFRVAYSPPWGGEGHSEVTLTLVRSGPPPLLYLLTLLSLPVSHGAVSGGGPAYTTLSRSLHRVSSSSSSFRLAQSRTNPQDLDIGLTAQDIQSAEILSPVDWDKVDSSTVAGKDDHLFGF